MKKIMGLSLLISQFAFGAFSNYNSILIGDLSAGLAGAGSATPGDASSASFYNPALLSAVSGSSFSAAVGIYKKFDTVYDKSEDSLAAPLRVNKGYFRSLPSSTGNVIGEGDYKFALSIVTPDYEQYTGPVFSNATRKKTINMTDESLWVGASIAKKLSDKKHVGITIYYTARNYSLQENEREQPTATDLTFRTFESRIKENAIVPVVGYFEQINEQWAWGTSLRFMAMKIAGKASADETSIDVTGGTITTDAQTFESVKSKNYIPMRWNIGTSYNPNPNWTVAFETNIHEGFSYNDVNNPTIERRIRRKAVANFSLGTEYAWKEWLKTRLGVFTNFSAHPDPNSNVQIGQEDKVDMLGFSANLVFITDKRIAYTFGGYYTGGWGRSLQNAFNQYQIVTKDQHIFTMLVGTSFYF